MPDSVKEGDFALLDYTLRVKESGEVVDTTIESVAKQGKLHAEETIFEPALIVLGEGRFPKGLEEKLLGQEVEKPTVIEVSPENGFGQRESGKVRLVPLRRFREKGIEPESGMQVEVEGRPGIVRAVGAGRVQVDYNHPLAGKTLLYEVNVKKLLETPEEKIRAIVHRRISTVQVDKFMINVNDSNVTIEVPEEAFYLKDLQIAKKSISTEIEKFLPNIGKIAFLEFYKTSVATVEPAPPEAPTGAEEKPVEAEPPVAE